MKCSPIELTHPSMAETNLPPAGGLDPAARRFAAEQMGPASSRCLAGGEVQARIQARIRGGAAVADAVLAEIHAAAAGDRQLADEFLSYFLQDLLKLGHGAMRPALRRYMDTGDLVQSVLGSFWQEIFHGKFQSRAQFCSYLAQRLRWKASDRERALQTGRRREDRRIGLAPEQRPAAARDETPSEQLGRQEEIDRILVVLARLPELERELLRGRLRGEAVAGLAFRLHMTVDQARQGLQRARNLARRLLT